MKTEMFVYIAAHCTGSMQKYGPLVLASVCRNPGRTARDIVETDIFSAFSRIGEDVSVKAINRMLERLEAMDLIAGSLTVGQFDSLADMMGENPAGKITYEVSEHGFQIGRERKYYPVLTQKKFVPVRGKSLNQDASRWIKIFSGREGTHVSLDRRRAKAGELKSVTDKNRHDRERSRGIAEQCRAHLGDKKDGEFIRRFAFWAAYCASICNITPENVISQWYTGWEALEMDKNNLPREIKMFRFFAEGYDKVDFCV